MVGKNLMIFMVSLWFMPGANSTDPFHDETLKLKNYKVVIPQLIQERWRRDANIYKADEGTYSESLTYSVWVGGKARRLHLNKNKDFLPSNFAVVLHDPRSNSFRTHARKHVHCHYSGHVEGYEDSLVALSTCRGLRGVILIGNESYGIEPAPKSTVNQHIVFPLKDNEPMPFVCGISNDSSHSEDHESVPYFISHLRKKRALPQTKYIELALVVDNQRFVLKARNTTAVREEMVELGNLLDNYYKKLNIRIVLVGLMIFETENPFDVDGAPGKVLNSFVRWRRSNLSPTFRNDVAHLIVGRSGAYSGGVLGMAYVGTVCSAHTSGGINVFGGNNLQYVSTVVAHELGHNLGMNHDSGRCTCDGGSCIMSAVATGSTLFSTCSDAEFERLVLRGGGVCLRNQPSQQDLVTVAVCGNGKLESDEECDCGTPEECTNECCDAATCKLTSGSTCASGSCCENCQLKVSGTSCRRSVNVCDLPEFCDGNSPFCPDDFYLLDGLPCENNSTYCYEGRCQTFTFQCKHLFGSEATKADDKCFRFVNTQGTTFGNCGYSGSRPTPCSVANSMCGKIQCSNFDANDPPEGAIISVQVIEPGVSCKNADFNLGPDVLDPAYVNTGSPCGQGKACLDFQCVDAAFLKPNLTCDAKSTCNNNGLCNNMGNCHCNPGWSPPLCNERGRGGSVDSGPAQIDFSLRNGLLIFFLGVLPILTLIIIGLLYAFKRDVFHSCPKVHRSKSYRSRNATNDQRSGNAQTAASPPPPTQGPASPTPVLPYTPKNLAMDPRLGEMDYSDNGSVHAGSSQPHMQGPGVPKPIPRLAD